MSRFTSLIYNYWPFLLAFSFAIYKTPQWLNAQPTQNHKELSLQSSKEIVRRTHKLIPEFKLQIINNNENYKPQVDEIISLSAKISLQQHYPKLYYQWTLQEGLSPLPGQVLSGEIVGPDPMDPPQLELQVQNQTQENRKIFLKVWVDAANNGKHMSATQYDTQNYLELKEEQEALQERQEEYLIEQGETIKKYK